MEKVVYSQHAVLQAGRKTQVLQFRGQLLGRKLVDGNSGAKPRRANKNYLAAWLENALGLGKNFVNCF